MRDERENILYVGKAKNLRQRLNSYRVANPDRLSRRHLRLLNQVVRIEWKLCGDESSALATEAELLRSIRPKFNRAGIWPGQAKSVLWRIHEGSVELKIGEAAEAGWQVIGPIGGARWLLLSLVRLLWAGMNVNCGVERLPAGWFAGKLEEITVIPCGEQGSQVGVVLSTLSKTGATALGEWIHQRRPADSSKFELAWLAAELELLTGFKLERENDRVTRQVRDEQRLFAFA